MNREEAVKFLLEELKKVPNRDVLRLATEEQMERIAAELDLETMKNFLKEDDLKLNIQEIPEELYTEISLYFCMLQQFTGRYVYDSEVWACDENTLQFIESVRKSLKVMEYLELADATIAEFLAYAKSDKPDF